MEIKLCYKTYNAKLTLGAMRSFHEQTGLDLWYTLLRFADVYIKTKGSDDLTRLVSLYSLIDFDTAAKLIHCLIRKEDTIPLDEIADAMFRVGWKVSDDQDEFCEPWPLVICKIAFDVDKMFSAGAKKKDNTKHQ
jgi:hypothetical protein